MDRLKALRILDGLSQEELAESLGISKQYVSQMEKGRRQPRVDFSPLGYSKERLADLPTMTMPMHRQLARTRVSSSARAKEIVRLAGEIYQSLRHEINVADRLDYADYPQSPQGFNDVEDLAIDTRVAVLGVEESGPIKRLTSIVERAGIALTPILGMDGVFGLSSWVGDEAQPVVGLNPEVSGERFRFSLAHEIGHLVMHSKSHDLAEDEAHRFAGALLFPQEDFVEAIPKRPNLSDFLALKESWGMSVAALVRRAYDLQLMDSTRYRSLQVQTSSRWGRKSEPNDSTPVPGGVIPKMIERQGGVVAAADQLGIRASHIVLTIDWVPTQDRHLSVVR